MYNENRMSLGPEIRGVLGLLEWSREAARAAEGAVRAGAGAGWGGRGSAVPVLCCAPQPAHLPPYRDSSENLRAPNPSAVRDGCSQRAFVAGSAPAVCSALKLPQKVPPEPISCLNHCIPGPFLNIWVLLPTQNGFSFCSVPGPC